MKLRDYPALCKAIECTVSESTGPTLVEDWRDIEPLHFLVMFTEEQLQNAEDSAADYDGKAINAFIDSVSLPKDFQMDQDALEYIARNPDELTTAMLIESTASADLLMLIHDAYEGDLGVALYA